MSRKTLTTKQKEAIDCLTKGWNQTETCDMLKIHIATLWRWKKQDKFKAELDKRTNRKKEILFDRVNELIDRSKQVLLEALETREKKPHCYIKVALEILKTYKPQPEEPEKPKEQKEPLMNYQDWQAEFARSIEETYGGKSTSQPHGDEDILLSKEDLERMTSEVPTPKKATQNKNDLDYPQI